MSLTLGLPKLFVPQPEGLFLCGETEAQVTPWREGACPGRVSLSAWG